MKQNELSQAMIRQIAAHTKCAVCGKRFRMGDIQIVGHRDNVWAMRASCRECRTTALLLAVISQNVTRSIYTDLAPEEWERFKSSVPVDVDDVIRFYQAMDAYDGDFSDILEEPLSED